MPRVGTIMVWVMSKMVDTVTAPFNANLRATNWAKIVFLCVSVSNPNSFFVYIQSYLHNFSSKKSYDKKPANQWVHRLFLSINKKAKRYV